MDKTTLGSSAILGIRCVILLSMEVAQTYKQLLEDKPRIYQQISGSYIPSIGCVLTYCT